MKISIITAVLNSKNTLIEAIKSLSDQTYLDIEHIIIDGGSTDGTVDLIREYEKSHGSEREIKWLSEPDRGMYDALNKGIGLATGEVIGLLHSDDFYAHDSVLTKVAEAFEKDGVDSCYGDLVYVDSTNTNRTIRFWRSGSFNERSFYWGWMPPHPTFFVNREIYNKYGGFNLELGSAADYELMLRFLLRYGISTAYIPEVLVKMRVGGASNASLRNRIHANLMDRRAWRVNGLKPHPWTLWLKPLRKLPQFLFLNHPR